jgi:hypothetical protein
MSKSIQLSKSQLSQSQLPDNYDQLGADTQVLVTEYINNLSEIEKKAYMIARDHLGSSFNLIKSNGFNDWLKEIEKERENEKKSG